jgi:hypothetical protein
MDNAYEERLKGDKVKKYLQSTDFFIEDRDLQVAERLRDLKKIKTESQFRQVMEPIFKWVNLATNSLKSGIISDTPVPNRFEFNPADIQRYFGEWLPSQMGIYLARLHKLGLVHQFPHAQNWSVVGTLYDLDSVWGSVLGDPLITDDDIAKDTRRTVGAITELLVDSQQNYLNDTYPGLAEQAQSIIISSYIKERFGFVDSTTLEKIKSSYFSGIEINIDEQLPIDSNVWANVVASTTDSN